MRCPGGYGGPVAHWWAQSLLYTGPGLDWRYEGVIAGYLNLWSNTNDSHWLDKARRAGDDLVTGQLSNSHVPVISSAINPLTAGTPHEAACDVGLLLLARKLKAQGDPDWELYFACAKRNLESFYIQQLWDPHFQSFRDSPNVPSFVPNKAATACEAFFLLAEMAQDESWIERYALPTLERIIDHQVRKDGHLDGAIAQNNTGGRRVEKYFPFYIARCVPALVTGYECSQEQRYLEAALYAMAFIQRWRCPDGSFPQVIYPAGRINRYPQWIAALGEILRVMQLLEPCGLEANPGATQDWLLAGQSPSGGFYTAHGFTSQVSQRKPGPLPDFRDLLPVVGWNAMAFRYLSTQVTVNGDQGSGDRHGEGFEKQCTFRGRRMLYREDHNVIEVFQNAETRYRWRRSDPWAEVAAPEFWLK